jgi:hypothetical protein
MDIIWFFIQGLGQKIAVQFRYLLLLFGCCRGLSHPLGLFDSAPKKTLGTSVPGSPAPK